MTRTVPVREAAPGKRVDFKKRYGWRARIGLISPAILDTSAEQMRKILPEGVLLSAITISAPIQNLGTEQGTRAFDLMVEGGKRLAAEKVDALAGGGFAHGDRPRHFALAFGSL